MYGGFSARFWLMRKHIIQLTPVELENLPFYCWECISIETQYRTIDLVIKDLSDMETLLKFLIYKLETQNGQKGSASKLFKDSYNEKFRQLCFELKTSVFSSEQKDRLKRISNESVVKKIIWKYKIMKWRSKISFSALQYRMAVKEYWMYVILKTIQDQIAEGDKKELLGLKETCHPLFLLYVGESQNVRKFKLNKIVPIKLTPESKLR